MGYNGHVWNEVKEAADIVSVVGEYLPGLKRVGTLWKACCPFHGEKTPSFTVNPLRQSYKCFGCGVGGDVISFVREYNALPDNNQALEELAALIHFSLPEQSEDSPRQMRLKEFYRANELAQEFFVGELGKNNRAQDYLFGERGFTAETAELLGVGFTPQNSQLKSYLLDSNVTEITAVEVGLLNDVSNRGPLPVFWEPRITFPFRDYRGKVRGFTARLISKGDARSPKYTNTRVTEIFNKGKEVYGLDLALQKRREFLTAAGKSGQRDKLPPLIVTEGQTDVGGAYQSDLLAVACSGGSFSHAQARLIAKYGFRDIRLVFDDDKTGTKYAREALEHFFSLGIVPKVIGLSGDNDLFDVAERAGFKQGALRQELAKAVMRPIPYLLRGSVSLFEKPDDCNDLNAVIEPILDVIHQAPSEPMRLSLARELGMSIASTAEDGLRIYRESLERRLSTSETSDHCALENWDAGALVYALMKPFKERRELLKPIVDQKKYFSAELHPVLNALYSGTESISTFVPDSDSLPGFTFDADASDAVVASLKKLLWAKDIAIIPDSMLLWLQEKPQRQQSAYEASMRSMLDHSVTDILKALPNAATVAEQEDLLSRLTLG